MCSWRPSSELLTPVPYWHGSANPACGTAARIIGRSDLTCESCQPATARGRASSPIGHFAVLVWGGGEGGIRTPDTVTRMPHFECGAFNHSATSPVPLARVGPYLIDAMN